MEAFDDYPPPPPPRPRRRGLQGLQWPEALRDPRRRLLAAAAAALLLVLIVVGTWWANPTNRARRALAAANEHILDKQRDVIDARRLLTQRIAELRAAQAEAQVQVARYQAALDRATRPTELDSATAAGDVLPGDTALVPPAGSARVPAGPASSRP